MPGATLIERAIRRRRSPLTRALLSLVGLAYRLLLLLLAGAVALVDLQFLLPQSHGSVNRGLDLLLLLGCLLFALAVLYPVARPQRLPVARAYRPPARHVSRRGEGPQPTSLDWVPGFGGSDTATPATETLRPDQLREHQPRAATDPPTEPLPGYRLADTRWN